MSYSYYPSTHRNAGQVATTTQVVSSAITATVRSAYDALGRLTHRWGSGTQPVKHVYDPVHGGMTEMWTYKGDTIPDSATTPPAAFDTVSAAAVTQWSYHSGTAVLWKKTDALNRATEYAYHPSGLLSERKWARLAGGTRLTTTYAYETAAGKQMPGRLTGIAYSDATPDVTWTYHRDGRAESCTDAGGAWGWAYVFGDDDKLASVESVSGSGLIAGTETYRKLRADGLTTHRTQRWGGTGQAVLNEYDASGRFQAARIKHNKRGWIDPANYDMLHGGSRVPDANRTATSYTSAPGYGSVSMNWNYDTSGRVQDVVYSTGMSATGAYAPSVPMGWSVTEFDGAGRRVLVKPYKAAGENYTATQPPAWSYGYNARGEVTGASRFRAEGGTPPASQSRGYAYDGMGNRTAATQGAVPVRTTVYPTTNALNQYEAITNPRALEVSGTIAEGFEAVVNVNNGPDVGLDSGGTGDPGSFRADTTTLASGLWQEVKISAKKISTNETTMLSQGHRYTPPASETLLYDLDGNTTEDARWTYTWDAENRMIGAEEKASSFTLPPSSLPLPPRKRLTFAYDHKHRRIAKMVEELQSGTWVVKKDLRFLYDGWNLTVELDHTAAALNAAGNGQAKTNGFYLTGNGLNDCTVAREFFWGPDLSGTLDGAGGVGGLVSIRTQGENYLPCIDMNGNVKGLMRLMTGNRYQLTARYDYDPFGNRITDTGPGVELCPFGFSTKYRDEETGDYDFGYRRYQPPTGRWLSLDPIGEQGGINLYGMVGNDPVNWFDDLGAEKKQAGPNNNGGVPTNIRLDFETIWLTTLYCGQASWRIKWKLMGGKPSKLSKIVQRVTMTAEIKNCAGADITPPYLKGSGYKYTELFEVINGATTSTQFDTFFNGEEGICSRGRMTIEGDAQFHDQMNYIPSGYSQKAVHASGGLYARLGHDHFSNGSNVIKRKFEFRWSCCKNSEEGTERETHIVSP
ncbi:MAG: RHS repeat-associated core domain-containing protein [Fimbriimonadaceae bacterium]